MKKGKDLKVGDTVFIYYRECLSRGKELFHNKMGVITEIVGYKSTVFVDGALQSWVISDLKKMAAAKEMKEMYNESR